MKKNLSPETQLEALAIAKATQRPAQTKEQTKLIAAGIEKGIAEFKKQHKVKARDRDKMRKQQQKSHNITLTSHEDCEISTAQPQSRLNPLTWSLMGLLLLSWALFAAYLLNR
jgi:hypothetical protein